MTGRGSELLAEPSVGVASETVGTDDLRTDRGQMNGFSHYPVITQRLLLIALGYILDKILQCDYILHNESDNNALPMRICPSP